MSISPALDIARRALLAQEAALGTVGHNIANVNTPGYTRQVSEFESEPGRPVGGGVIVGGGVRLGAVSQAIDPLLLRRRLAAETDGGEQAARRDQLQSLAGVVNDLAEPSLAGVLEGFFDAADALARNPDGLAERQTLLGRANAVAFELNRRGLAVAGLQRAVDARLVSVVEQSNGDLEKVADLNHAIVTAEVDGQRANDLRDQRQAVLNGLAGRLGISAIEDERGAVTVASTAGAVLVAGNAVVHRLAVQAAAAGLDGSVLHDVGIRGQGGAFIPVPEVFGSGATAALLDVRDGSLATAAANLDTVAGALRDAVNAIQTDPLARDLDGNTTTTAPLFAGTGARDLQVAITDPHRVAAALSLDPGDNQNALRLADLRTAAPADVAPASTAAVAVGSLSLAQYLATELGRIGEDAALADDAAAASDLLTQQLEAQRAALSGVNLNEELADLLKHQRAFQAVAQLLNVANSMLDELMRVI